MLPTSRLTSGHRAEFVTSYIRWNFPWTPIARIKFIIRGLKLDQTMFGL